jgi:signal peptidase I
MPLPSNPDQSPIATASQVLQPQASPSLAANVARLRPGWGVWLRDLMISLAISAFIIIFIYQPVKVEGTSMMPSLED